MLKTNIIIFKDWNLKYFMKNIDYICVFTTGLLENLVLQMH